MLAISPPSPPEEIAQKKNFYTNPMPFIYQSTLKQKYFCQVNFSLAIMDIGANLVAFVRMDGCPVRRYSIPQRYTPERKFISAQLTKDPINFS